jgi:hypothetical protein
LAVSKAVIAVAVLAIAGLLAWLSFSPKPGPAPEPVLTTDARAYLDNLKLSEVQPQTSESYIQKSLLEILGKITNAGGKTVTSVRVKCVFRDYNGRELKRELATVVKGPLTPGGTKPFRLAFDDIPDGWNQQMPDFVIAEIGF